MPMSRSWLGSVHDHYQNALSILTGKPSSSPLASPDHHHQHHPPSHSHPNASTPALLWADMPSNTLPTSRYLTRRLKTFIDNHDTSDRDPIALDSDEDPSQPPPQSSPTGLSTNKTSQPLPSAKRSERSDRRSSEIREESRLLGAYSRRAPDPNAFVIADPMKRQPFTPHRGIRPINNLDAPRNTSRSAEILGRTTTQREGQRSPVSKPNAPHSTIPISHRSAPKKHPQSPRASHLHLPTQDDNHHVPNKRQKLNHSNDKGSTSTSPIALDDANVVEDSSDELQFSPVPPLKSRPTTRQVTTNSHNSSKPHELPSPVTTEHEGDFTREAAKQRKATKNAILSTSSPAAKLVSSPEPPSVSDPTFAKPPLPSRTSQATTDPTISRNNRSNRHPSAPDPPIHSLATRDLTSLITEGPMNSSSSKFSNGFPRSRLYQPAPQTQFNLKEVVYPGLPSSDIFSVQIQPEQKQFFLNTQDPQLGNDHVAGPFHYIKLAQIRTGPCPIVSFLFARTQTHKSSAHELHLRFVSEKSASDFLTTLLNSVVHLRVVAKEAEWLEDSFQKAKSDLEEVHGRPLDPDELEAEDRAAQAQTPQATRSSVREKRTRLVDRLDEPAPPAKRSKAFPTTDNVEESTSKNQRINEARRPDDVTQDARVERAQRRTNRAQDQRVPFSHASSPFGNGTLPRYSETGKLGKPWVRDLVYPKPGKRSATVPFEDLSRLDDDEFLNDNLIMFFVQYLETHMERHNPELHKRTYFFNTYFFERLTKDGSHRHVNYESVSRWTKAIDLFSRDFVVVPVNENLHWYLAIICNLPQLRGPSQEGESEEPHIVIEEDAAVNGTELTETETDRPPLVEADLAPEVQEQLAHQENETRQSLAELTIYDQMPDTTKVPQSGSKLGPGRKSKQQIRRSLPKYESDQPIIITLDSLGLSRYSTCSALKQYIVAEGKDKRNLEIDSTSIRGMTAKEIPNQNNFSDCGLYLCMYLEQFVADPHKFIDRILQRNEDAQQWPKQIRSGSLRSRLRELILEVHRRQEKEESQYEIPKVGDMMIERQTDSSPTARQYSKSDVQSARERFDRVADGLTVQAGASGVRIGGAEGEKVAPSSLEESVFDLQGTRRHGLTGSKPPTDSSHVIKPKTAMSQASKHEGSSEQAQRDKSAIGRNLANGRETVTGSDAALTHEQQQHSKRRPLDEIDALVGPREIFPRETRSSKWFHESPSDLTAQLRSSTRQLDTRKRKRNPGDDEEAIKSGRPSSGFLVGIESWAEKSGAVVSEQNEQVVGDAKRATNVRVEVKASQDSEGVDHGSSARKCRKKTPIADGQSRSFEQEIADSQEAAGGTAEQVQDSGRRTLHFTRKKTPPEPAFGSQRQPASRIEVIKDSQEASSGDDDNEMLLK